MSYKWPHDYCCIVTHNDNWFCKDCRKAHDRLYVNNTDKEHYCPGCVPDDIRSKSVDINQNCEDLKK